MKQPFNPFWPVTATLFLVHMAWAHNPPSVSSQEAGGHDYGEDSGELMFPEALWPTGEPSQPDTRGTQEWEQFEAAHPEFPAENDQFRIHLTRMRRGAGLSKDTELFVTVYLCNGPARTWEEVDLYCTSVWKSRPVTLSSTNGFRIGQSVGITGKEIRRAMNLNYDKYTTLNSTWSSPTLVFGLSEFGIFSDRRISGRFEESLDLKSLAVRRWRTGEASVKQTIRQYGTGRYLGTAELEVEIPAWSSR